MKEFATKISENIKNEKVDTTFDYTVRDDNLFAQKREKLSYSEKIDALGEIFQESIFERETIRFSESSDTNLVRKMYPHYNYYPLGNSEFMRWATVSYDPKVIKRIISSLRGDDIEKHVMSIINAKIDNPYTIIVYGGL